MCETCDQNNANENAAEEKAHHRYCPMAQEEKSTLCVCSELEKADAAAKKEAALEDAEDVCQRCREWPRACKCGDKRQWI